MACGTIPESFPFFNAEALIGLRPPEKISRVCLYFRKTVTNPSRLGKKLLIFLIAPALNRGRLPPLKSRAISRLARSHGRSRLAAP
jgi:hypothetical protein